MIDFATLQGLAIPEGVVTQITDASGRVLWSAVTAFEGTLYLRPSADVSFGGEKYPTDLAYGYLAISEEVADELATYVGVVNSGKSNAVASFEGTFALAPKEKVSIKRVLSGELFVKGESGYHNGTDHGDPRGIAVSITMLGVVYEFVQMNDGTGLLYGMPDTKRTFSIPSDMIASINNYVAANKTVPEMTIYLSAADCNHLDGTATVSARAVFDQVYLALECE